MEFPTSLLLFDNGKNAPANWPGHFLPQNTAENQPMEKEPEARVSPVVEETTLQL